MANLSKSERVTFDKLKDTEQEELLALPRTERSQKLAQLKASSTSTRGCFLLILLSIAAYMYADRRGMLKKNPGSTDPSSEQSENMDPLEVAERVEEFHRQQFNNALDGDPRRAIQLQKIWQDSMREKSRIELQRALGR